MNTYTKAALLLFAFIFMSCDKDYNTIGSDIVGSEHFDFEKYTVQNINVFTEQTNAVQSNNLTLNALGVYKNPVFGTTKAHIVSQLELVTTNPDLGYDYFMDPAKDSVYVYIPYFSTLESTDTSGNNTYTLDSIYGNKTNGKIDIKIYENGYFLNNFDPTDDFVSAQKYYTDDKGLITTNLVSTTGMLNNASVPSESSEFTISNNEFIIYKTDGNGQNLNSSGVVTTNPDEYVVKERKAPGIWINLNKTKFKERILDQAVNGKLFNNNVFKQHFKGLYFEVNNSGSEEDGFLAKLDLTKAEVVMQYQSYTTDQGSSPDPTNAVNKSIVFRMGYSATSVNRANTVNLIETTETANYLNALNGINTANTQGKLFLKGGHNGTVAFIDLFGSDLTGADNGGPNNIPDELDVIRENGWLINEANLVFYVDQAQMNGTNLAEPNRIYLYDATNNTVIEDYAYDSSVISTNTKYSKYIYSGIGEITDSKVVKYKFRITEYLNKLIKTTDTSVDLNIRLGLVVTESINRVDFLKIKTATSIAQVSTIPVASIMNPLGVILHGTQTSEIDKKLKLEIYYTQPN